MCKKLLIITIVVYVLQMVSTRDWTSEELADFHDMRIAELKDELAASGVDEETIAEQLTTMETMALSPANMGLPNKISVVQQWLQLETPKIFSGQIWRLLTCAFCHDRLSVFHILFNMLFFWWFGPRLESMYGSKEFLAFYLVSAVASSLCYIGIDLVSGDPVPMIGASGAVMAVTMLFAIHFPTHIVYIFFVVPVEVRWLVLFYVIMDLHPLILSLSGEGFGDSVAHAAHLGGLAFGYIYGKRQLRLFPYWSGLETWWKARRRGLKIVRSSVTKTTAKTEKLADDMDAILRKISDKGETSLTSAERRTLERASRQLRDRDQK